MKAPRRQSTSTVAATWRLLLLMALASTTAACGGRGTGNYTLEKTLDCMSADEHIYTAYDPPSDENPEGTGAEGSFDVDVLVGSDVSEVVVVFERSERDAERVLTLLQDQDLRFFGAVGRRPAEAVRNAVAWSGGLSDGDEDHAHAEKAVAAAVDCLR